MGLLYLWFIFFFFLVLSLLVFIEPLLEIFGVRVLGQVGIKLPFQQLHEEGLAAAPPAQTIERR
jgi:hypothetical protein